MATTKANPIGTVSEQIAAGNVYNTMTGQKLVGSTNPALQAASIAASQPGSTSSSVMSAYNSSPTNTYVAAGSSSPTGVNSVNNIKAPSLPNANINTNILDSKGNVTFPTKPVPDLETSNGVINGANATIQKLTLDQQKLAEEQKAQDLNNQKLQDIKNMFDNAPTSESIYQKALNESGKVQAQQKVNDLTSQLNQIVAQGQANQMNVVGQGRGIPEAIIGGQQAQFARETAIQSLPVSAQLSAAQGNLEMATENLNTLFKIRSDDATKEYNYKTKLVDTFYDFADKQSQSKLADIKTQQQYEHEDLQNQLSQQNTYAKMAYDNGQSSLGAQISKLDYKSPTFKTDLANLQSKLTSITVNDFQKLSNGDTVLVNKITGKIVKNLGGGTTTESDTPLIRTVITSDGKTQAVDGYTLSAGDDPYFIAQKNGTDMVGLKALNPKITDWNNLPVGAVINIPNKTMNGSLLATTGLSNDAFQYLIIGNTALTRMPDSKRTQVKNEARNFTTSMGIDEATFRQQYAAIGKTVEANTLRNNQAVVAENELSGTLSNLSDAAKAANLSSLKGLNVAKIWAGSQLNNEQSATFKFHLEQLRNEFAMYNAAVAGQIDANGNIRQIDDSDKKKADYIIQQGFASGSLAGFETALKNSTSKMGSVLKNSVDAQNKAVWNIFGVGDKYQSPQVKQDPMVIINNVDKKNPELIDQIRAAMPTATVEEIANYLTKKGY